MKRERLRGSGVYEPRQWRGIIDIINGVNLYEMEIFGKTVISH